jgi:thiosulfate dehydrogenase [quinone] large subunit
MWLQAGIPNIWGAKSPSIMHNGGAGVNGSASHATAAYIWWGSFLQSFVVPNAGWIAVLVAISEFVIGVCLIADLLTRLVCLGSLALLFTCVMSGTASVCAIYALFAIVLLGMWRTASWIGVDGLLLGFGRRRAATTLGDTHALKDPDTGRLTASTAKVTA